MNGLLKMRAVLTLDGDGACVSMGGGTGIGMRSRGTAVITSEWSVSKSVGTTVDVG